MLELKGLCYIYFSERKLLGNREVDIIHPQTLQPVSRGKVEK